MSTRTVALTRETIAAAALRLADQEGFAAVSMRRVAEQLGVGTMSLYYYVKTRNDLLSAMDDALMGEAILPTLPAGWQNALLAIAHRTHAIFVRHPWALVSMLSAPPGLNAMRHMEQCLQALAETTLTKKQKITLLATMDDFVFGHALREGAAPTPETPDSPDWELGRARLASGDFPHLEKVFGKGRINPAPNRFELGLLALLRDATSRT